MTKGGREGKGKETSEGEGGTMRDGKDSCSTSYNPILTLYVLFYIRTFCASFEAFMNFPYQLRCPVVVTKIGEGVWSMASDVINI